MDNQHKIIKGYRDLSQSEIDLMNEIKQQGVILEALCSRLRGDPSVNLRWVSIGTTDLQTGLMALVRSVAQPTTF
jgi:hypothetical protein